MRRRRIARALVVAVAASVALGGCGDGGTAEPGEEKPSRHPLVGTYDVTTRLTMFSFETPAPSPPDCPDYTLYCTHRRGAGDATLSGVLVIGDSVLGRSPTLRDLPDVRATLTGRFCAAIDYAGLTGCSRAGESATLEYQGEVIVYEPFDGSAPFLFSLRGPGTFDRNVRFTSVRAAGDSLYGDVAWAMTVNRSPPAYYGTFVARRRR